MHLVDVDADVLFIRREVGCNLRTCLLVQIFVSVIICPMSDVMEGFKDSRNSKTPGSFSMSKGDKRHATIMKFNMMIIILH